MLSTAAVRVRPVVPPARTGDRAPLRLVTLGRFALVREGSPVLDADWRSKKARDLLKLLATRSGRPISRELLADALWPDDSPGRCANRLSVALSTVRTMLDPERRHPADHFLSTDRYDVQLTNLPVDVEVFLALSDQAMARHQRHEPDAITALTHAEAAYAGDFLPDDPHLECAVPLRERARASHLELLRALGTLAEQSGDHRDAMRYRLRALDRDPYDEPAHLGLIHAYLALGRWSDARRHYRSYATRMAELTLTPAPFPVSLVAG